MAERPLTPFTGTVTAMFALAWISVCAVSPGVPLQQPQASSSPGSAVPKYGTGLVMGEVVDGDSGKPISGALVTTIGGSVGLSLATAGAVGRVPWPIQVMADDNGVFVFSELPGGVYTITATKPGYSNGAYDMRSPTDSPTGLELREGQRLGGVQIRLWRYAGLGGRVTDENDDPVVGVTVRAFRRTFTEGRARWVGGGGHLVTQDGGTASAVTDDRGIYRIGRLLPGDYLIMVPSTQTTLPASLERGANAADMASELQRGLARLAPGVSPGSPNNVAVGDSVWQAGGGRSLPPLLASDGNSLAYPSAFAPAARAAIDASVVKVRSGEERVNVDVQMRPVRTSRVSGTLTGPSGQVGFVAVHLATADAADFPNSNIDAAATLTDATGAFTFGAVPAGRYTIRVLRSPSQAPTASAANSVVADPSLWAAVDLSVDGADVSNLAIVLRPGLRATGRVEFHGSAPQPSETLVSRINVFLVQPSDAVTNTGGRDSKTSTAGEFVTNSVSAGKFLVRADGNSVPKGWSFERATVGGQDVSDAPVELKDSDLAGVVVSFTDKQTTVSGVVRDAQGDIDKAATVVAFATNPDSWSKLGANPLRLRTARTNGRGMFTLTGLPPGDYFVVALTEEAAEPASDTGTWLQGLSAVATAVTVVEGDQKTIQLRTAAIR